MDPHDVGRNEIELLRDSILAAVCHVEYLRFARPGLGTATAAERSGTFVTSLRKEILCRKEALGEGLARHMVSRCCVTSAWDDAGVLSRSFVSPKWLVEATSRLPAIGDDCEFGPLLGVMRGAGLLVSRAEQINGHGELLAGSIANIFPRAE